jgi:hypothetical protein
MKRKGYRCMNHRLFVSMNVMAAALAMVILAPASAVGQQKALKKWVAPRTPDGQPDMRGSWTNSTYTPLERPVELGTKEFFTEGEAEAVEKQRHLKEQNQSQTDIHYDDALWQTEKYAKVISNLRTSMIFDPPNGRIPQLTADGERRLPEIRAAAKRRDASEMAEHRSLAERCIAWGNEGPPMIGSTYNANLQIVQTRDAFIISHEIIHGVRVIPLNGQPHLPASIQQLGGDSRGHWEGETLVVETTNFSNLTNFRGPPATTRQDIFSSDKLRVIERFTRVDPDTIQYRFTLEDPGTWTKPWSGELAIRKTQEPIYEYACHEGNYGLANILAGARETERKAEAARKATK